MHCTGLTSVSIGNSVSIIGDKAFHNCFNLVNLYITDLKSWCSIEFKSDDSNPSYWSSHVEGKEFKLFLNNIEVKHLVIPSDVTSIGAIVFQFYTGLLSVTIPSTITNIGEGAFWGCSRLAKITSLIEEPFALNYVFGNNSEDIILYVPKGTKAKYEATDGWKDFKNIVEMAVLDPIEGETTVNTSNLSGQDLTDNVVNDVYYNVGTGGYDATDGSIVIGETTNMSEVGAGIPGTSEVANNYTGLILKVAAGKGTITVNAKTLGNAQLVVQVGNGTPMIASKTEQGDVIVGYDVTEDTYVYIYASIISSNAPTHRAAPADAVKIYSITILPGVETGVDTVHSSQFIVHSYYTLDGRKLDGVPAKKGIYIVNGKKMVMK